MKNKTLKNLCVCAVCVALAMALSYLKIPIGAGFGGWGGSIDLVMIPIILAAVYGGVGWGLGAGLVFGTLKFFFSGGTAINWQSMLLDYSVAYMFARFLVHFFSGITIYAIVVPTEIMGLTTGSAVLYSILYNGSYMLPNTVLAVVLCALLQRPLRKVLAKG